MRRRLTFVILLMTLAVVFVVAGRQWHEQNEGLRREAARRRLALRDAQQLREEHERWAASSLPAAAVAQLRSERADYRALLAEWEALRRRVTASGPDETAPVAAPSAPRSLGDSDLTAAEWRNRGQATAPATLETALWAAAHGDLDTLVTLLAIDAPERERAATLLAAAPTQLQREIGTPEKLVALLTANAVPLGSARVLAEVGPADDRRLVVQMTDLDGQARHLELATTVRNGLWRLVVSPSALERLASTLRPTPTQ